MSTEHSCNTAPLQTGRCAKTCAKCAQLLKKQGIPFRLPFARPVYCLNISMHNRRKNGFNNCLCAAINSYYVNRFACFFVEKIRIISFTDESCMLFNVFSLAVQKRPFVELTNGLVSFFSLFGIIFLTASVFWAVCTSAGAASVFPLSEQENDRNGQPHSHCGQKQDRQSIHRPTPKVRQSDRPAPRRATQQRTGTPQQIHRATCRPARG